MRFAPVSFPRAVDQSNVDLAQDFLDLTFALESGIRLDRLLRYEQPVRVHLALSSPYRDDLELLVTRLRLEADLDIATTNDPNSAQIRIEAVPAVELARVFPSAACFIVPGETSWLSFLRRRPDARQRWSAQKTLVRAAIFLPADTTPQDVRDCLHEELTQALGPGNDLYRLSDSVWNDDNLHGAATPFDMLMLRILYRPELRSGMTRQEVAARLPSLLDLENPPGRAVDRRPRHPESRAWASAIETALSHRSKKDERLAAAQLATQLASEMQPVDHRLAVSLLTLGRLTLQRDPEAATRYFSEAYELSGSDPLRAAHAGVHVAAVAVAAGRLETAIALCNRHEPAARRGQNAILLASFLSIKAEALLGLGQTQAAAAARLDALRWARYGFGDADGALAREQVKIAQSARVGEG